MGRRLTATDFQNSHPELMSWFKPLSKVVGTHMAVGPCRSFYACIPTSSAGGTFYSPQIPTTLKNLLDASSSNPNRKFTTQVSLGYGGSWFVLWPNGDVSWDLAGQFEGLEDVLKKLPEKCISYLALNPWAPGQYFLVAEDGTVKFCLPAEWAVTIEEDIATWQNRFKTVTSSTIRGGKADSSTALPGGKIGLPIKEEKDGKSEKKGGHDLPPPYEGRHK
ncbi:uncharacterized protein BDR25DRAFT_306757 [Lindgomyces ingoldianus]|uniref:Uncharacterized protein n=1 Tax=Lindgomyces ingoldianus TaxID=673940 RepID=A0ACB6QE63_9PLEO|nr:uncharacterized protein BDR25DRAFT_306757 [Lindgomyces ingoldianus]KAF2465314.1 hypothetical protein BDR25DRAFT_306757 [Lindgomyces ingoldianus]